MYLYNLNLNPAAVVNASILGNFSGQKIQEIVVARNTRIELLRPDTATGKIASVLDWECFSAVRSLAPFRLTGASKDYIVVGSDSGAITILEYNPTRNVFDKVHQEVFGKSGVRRIVPGQYLATDPKGRAVMIGAVEKQKLVYILNRDSAARLTISSPLEAHKSHTLVHDCIGLDVGFENPIFACIEVDYSEADQDPTGETFQNTEKMLTYYELDLGLNHVVRKWSDPVDARANMLIQVPGGTDGPSGVIVCSENSIAYKHQDMPELRVPIPRRAQPLEDSERGLLLVKAVLHKMRVNKVQQFFFLAQSEEGDLYKITIDHEEGVAKSISIKYFDTVPIAAGLCILRSGFLFVGSEFGNHHLYSFEHLGDDDDDIEYSSADFVETVENDAELPLVYFKPRALKNLSLVDEMASMAPFMDAKVLNLTGEDTPQIYALCGKGARSTFRTLRHGMEITEMAVSELPGSPIAVWTTKVRRSDEYDAYIVVSFVNATLVLAIGETVEEVTDTGFLGTTPTLAIQQIGEDALIQVYPGGIIHILGDGRVNRWAASAGQEIVQAATNSRQVAIALTGAEIMYFELDQSGRLNETERKKLSAEITCLALGDVPEGRQRSRFLAVGCEDGTVRIFGTDPNACLESMSMQALQGVSSSLCVVEMADSGSAAGHGTLYLHIGLSNGVMLRTVLDSVTGQLSDSRTRFLGAKAVRLQRVNIGGKPAVLTLSTRPWLSYTFQSRIVMTPLATEMLESGCGFTSEPCPEGVVAVAGNTLRIFMVEKLGMVFNQTSIPLSYTPRKFMYHPVAHVFVVVEAEHFVYSPAEKARVLKEKEEEGFDIEEEITNLDPQQFGLVRYKSGKWASCIRIIDPYRGESRQVIELEENEAAFSVGVVQFHAHSQELFVVVGTGKDVTLSPRNCSAGYLHLYRFNQMGTLEFVYKTEVDDVPLALLPFQGRLLAGVGKALRIYDLGKKKLLRKCESKAIPTCIVSLHNQGDRIIIGDMQESVHYAIYRHMDNRILIFADDTTPRWLTSTVMIDYDTMAGGDKFGNFFVDRLPAEVSEEFDEDPTGNRVMIERSYLQGAANKLHYEAHYHVGDILTSIHRAILVPGGREVLLYSSLLGGIGVFIPFISKEDVEFFQQLEAHMRSEGGPLLGRDHLAYRSFYVPVRNVIDGTLCEGFNLLSADKKRSIAEDLDRTVEEVHKKIEDMRVRAAF
ncbi:hypothetical protein BZG36_01775 [Bifiguratus adelaidae]|uniref:DNA damage-binding protein 1 n=1 Tax=Bifiguratus adelaidae TaxID=1938954 RepID=A0A261Y2Z4_9FUNG|nr:hypothetical protein BZG36_01775 [Bifiguratus adelaidae]